MSEENSESLVDTVKGAVKARLEHPVFGALLIAIVISNWRFLICLVVSDAKAPARIDQASLYLTTWSLFGFPVLLTLVYVLCSPIFRALAGVYDRAVANWESVRAYKAAIKVVEAKIVAGKTELASIETELTRQKNELRDTELRLNQAKSEKEQSEHALLDFMAMTTGNWRAAFPGVNLPVNKANNPGGYTQVEARFKRLEALKHTVLRP